MFDVITIGGATRDITFVNGKGEVVNTPEDLIAQKKICFEYGAKFYSEETYFSFGGGAANIAFGLAKLGLKVSAVLKIGKDENGKAIKRNLSGAGINIDLVQQDKNLKTGISFIIILEHKKERTIFACRGANEKLKIKNEKLKRTIKNSKWIYLTSLSGNWKENFDKIIKLVKKNKIKLAFNPGSLQIKAGAKALKEILGITDILFVNKDEAIELVISSLGRRHDIVSLARLLKTIHKFGPEIVVITDGNNGAYVLSDKKIFRAMATDKKIIDATGAGDAFGSGFLGGLILKDNKIDQALKYGIVNSESVITVRGAQNGLLDRKEIDKKIGRIKVKRL